MKKNALVRSMLVALPMLFLAACACGGYEGSHVEQPVQPAASQPAQPPAQN